MSYGFKKVITLKELLSLEVSASMWIGIDFYESKWSILKTRSAVLKRFNMTMEELRADLKFSAAIISCATHRILSFTQVLLDILSSKDGSLSGEARGPSDPPAVTLITLNPDLYYSSTHPTVRLGPKAEEIML
eukprot:CAMPEP_0185568570 /NCGR_PEP_ID=MMETSP0434-20130131/1490_1 /TAXON_ID=626734 ORGANISM="Favella taraikaensis, Strain Fe Narragansett Bay" /NCGR_SAMPLE_ID=MMETSP0434 /ASSEMBLY_ACC=CAM_ASM_000379 /LENGTH=132 /DNA_ID=CAMNT_0028183131 /DNA_START=509 /DNA_END=907 /DNA_ORIENTATION=-